MPDQLSDADFTREMNARIERIATSLESRSAECNEIVAAARKFHNTLKKYHQTAQPTTMATKVSRGDVLIAARDELLAAVDVYESRSAASVGQNSWLGHLIIVGVLVLGMGVIVVVCKLFLS